MVSRFNTLSVSIIILHKTNNNVTIVTLQPHSMLAATAARDLKVDRLSHSDVGPKLATNDAGANDLSMLESKHVVYRLLAT